MAGRMVPRLGYFFIPVYSAPHPGAACERSHVGLRGGESQSAGCVLSRVPVGISGDRSSSGAAAQAISFPGGSLPDPRAARRQEFYHRDQGVLFSSTCIIRCVRKRTVVSWQPNLADFEKIGSMDRLLGVMTVASLLLIGLVLASVRREHIRVEYSISWLVAGLALLVLSLWKSLDQRIALALKIPDLAVTLLTVCGVLFLGVLFAFSLRLSQLKDSSIKLAQRVAILEYRLESLAAESALNTAPMRADAAGAYGTRAKMGQSVR